MCLDQWENKDCLVLLDLMDPLDRWVLLACLD